MTPKLTAEEARAEYARELRRIKGQLGARTLHSRVSDPTAHTAPARQALRNALLHDIDPDNTMDPAERDRRFDHAVKARMAALALASAKARRARRELLAATTPDLEALGAAVSAIEIKLDAGCVA